MVVLFVSVRWKVADRHADSDFRNPRSSTGSLRSDFRNPRLTSDFPAWISGIRGRRTARRGRIPKIGGGRRGRCLRFVKSRFTDRLLLRLYGRWLVHDFSLQNNKKKRKKQLGEARKQVAEDATLKLVKEIRGKIGSVEYLLSPKRETRVYSCPNVISLRSVLR